MEFTRNLSSVQHLARAWSPVDSSSSWADVNEKRRSRSGLRVEGGEEEVLCPRPRRPTTVNCPSNEYMKPHHRQKSISSARTEGVVCFELLDIFFSKGRYRDVSNYGCSPLNFCGSSPNRASNPLIHDTQFLHPQTTSNVSQQVNSCGPSFYSSNPTVRIEGFGPVGSDLSSQVSSLA